MNTLNYTVIKDDQSFGGGHLEDQADLKKILTMQQAHEQDDFDKNLSPEERRTRTRIMIASLAALFSINTLLLCAEAVLPIYIEKNHNEYIGDDKTALILA